MANNLIAIPEVKKIYELLNPKPDLTRFVGGCVRDIILNDKIGDIDFATILNPEEVIINLQSNKIEFKKDAINFGVVTAIINNISFEITTLRQDLFPDGRYAKIVFTKDWKIDVQRRDFTINAIYCGWTDIDENTINFWDPYNGKKDLIEGKIKFISDPEISLQEDYVRAIRYLRFFYKYSRFPHDCNILDKIFKYKKNIKNISNKRLEKEIKKILLLKNSRDILQDKNVLDLFVYIYPGFDKVLNSSLGKVDF